ncbi:hypothetical protein [Saccharibacillus deserti]|uniref:hypothetical protein n=1 Tax=Saccharibacillus deserti TaxID=1634444 RepID=UPI001557CB67|nr:hypothetical protein [Saccharibacillus deserti]
MDRPNARMEFRYEVSRHEVLETDVPQERIAQMLRLMDDLDRTFCVLSFSDQLYIQCAGSAEEMIVEMRVPHRDEFRHFAIGQEMQIPKKNGFLRPKSSNREVVETFDAAVSEVLFRYFAETRDIPPGFVKRDMTDFFE